MFSLVSFAERRLRKLCCLFLRWFPSPSFKPLTGFGLIRPVLVSGIASVMMDGRLLSPSFSPSSPVKNGWLLFPRRTFLCVDGGFSPGSSRFCFSLQFLWFLVAIDSPLISRRLIFLPSSEVVSSSRFRLSLKVTELHAGKLMVDWSIEDDWFLFRAVDLQSVWVFVKAALRWWSSCD